MRWGFHRLLPPSSFICHPRQHVVIERYPAATGNRPSLLFCNLLLGSADALAGPYQGTLTTSWAKRPSNRGQPPSHATARVVESL